MALSRVKNWIANEVLTAAALNAEFNNILNNGQDVAFPSTKAVDFNGQELQLDSDKNTFITADTDDQIDIKVMGEGFSWDSQDRQRDIAAANAAWEMAKEMITDPAFGLVVLDELNIPLRYDHLDINEVVAGLLAKREDLHVVVTGRNAKAELIEAADMVTDMTMVKHHFRDDVKAQNGIEF